MKLITRFLGVGCLLCLLAACGESHFMTDASYRAHVEDDFQQKKAALSQGDLFAVLDGQLTTYEREALEFLYAYMTIGDVTDYSGEYYLENIRLSQQAQREMPWGKLVPEDLFRHFVLPIRVNNENLDDARKVFYAELKDRVKGLSMKDAVLEVNHWCHEKVNYRPSDPRTSSPLASVRTAYGRCGEESTFTVAALRSVGIPARQVYTPRWAHTDNNHAWVEAWADGQWYFLGACEPEPVLNLGWFNAPASRGMLMHTRVFGRYEGPEEVMSVTPNHTEINVIENYAPTAKATVTVVDEAGNAVPDANVQFKLYNYAEYYTVATKHTDANGVCWLTAGKGDMVVWASKEGRFGFDKLSFGKQDELKIVLNKKEGDAFSIDFDIVPPAENANLPEVTPEQRAENDRRMAQEDSIRNAYVATMMSKEQAAAWLDNLYGAALQQTAKDRLANYLFISRGNHQVLTDFLSALRQGQAADKLSAEELRAHSLLDAITMKDLRDITPEVLADHLNNSAMGNGLKPELVTRALLNPRVSTEMLTPYKKVLREALLQAGLESAEGTSIDQQAGRLIAWCKENIQINDEHNSRRIPISPMGVWRARVADKASRNIFFVAAARSLGIPAWIDEVTGKVQFATETIPAQDVNFDTDARPVQTPTGVLQSPYKPTRVLDNPKYYSHFTLSKFKDGSFQLLSYDEGEAGMEEGVTWEKLLKNGTKLDEGYYLLVTGTRMASGAALSKATSFTISPEGTGKTVVELVMRESEDQVQVIGDFNSESLYTPLQGIGTVATEQPKQSILQACGRGYFVVGILGVGQEPTNHALRDIAALKADLEGWGRTMVLLFPDEAQAKKYRLDEFPELPSTITYGLDTDGIASQIVSAMKLKPNGSLPIFIIADTFNRVVFVSQGYTIGLGEQLMKTVKGL